MVGVKVAIFHLFHTRQHPESILSLNQKVPLRNILLSFLFLCTLGVVVVYVDWYTELEPVPDLPPHDPDYVSIVDGQLSLQGKAYFPKIINFPVTLRQKDSVLWPSVYIGYMPGNRFTHENPELSHKELKAYLELIAELGFNALRIVGIGEAEVADRVTGRVHFRVSRGEDHNAKLYLRTEQDRKRYFDAVRELIRMVESAGLHAILTTRNFHEAPETETHLARLCTALKNERSILAFDFFNEPLYFDSLARESKKEVFYITKRWHEIVKRNAPHHLTTIGLACQREVFEWDPNLMNVDFISFHPYEYEPDQVRNELYWYKHFVDKPWIIGETGIPSNNDSIPYQDQVLFARKTLQRNIDCGGMGYSWWQFKDVDWGGYHQNYLGVYNGKGYTLTLSGDTVAGTPKPVTREIAAFNPFGDTQPCNCLDNYYNFGSHKAFRLSGRLLDEDGNPLNGGGALAWDDWWVNHHFTTTKPDGYFELYSEYPFYHWMVSASRYEMIRKDCKPDTAHRGADGIPTIRLGEIRLRKLDIPELWQDKAMP
jgi:Cellulase (glycosyl hydrolase family 5)